MALHNHNLNDAIEGAAIGTAISLLMSFFRPEIIEEVKHGGLTIFWALVAATLVFFYNRLLRKKFPDNDKGK
jgi:hypothetical protein